MTTLIKLKYHGKEVMMLKKGMWIRPGQTINVAGDNYESLLKKGFKVHRDPHGHSGEIIENPAALENNEGKKGKKGKDKKD